MEKYLRNDYLKKANIKNSHYEIQVNENILIFVKKITEKAILKDPNICPTLAYDVGAYIGSSIPRIKALGFKNIVCFEPDDISFNKLKNNYENDVNIVSENLGVSNKDDHSVLYACDRGRDFLNTTDPSWIKQTRHKNLVTNLQEKKMKVITLDSYNKNKRLPAYVKIDVEGHEENVLLGMSFKPAILSFEWISELSNKNKNCINIAYNLGFTKFNLDTREEEVLGPDDVWLDVDQAIEKFEEIKKSDLQNNVWGNAWCI